MSNKDNTSVFDEMSDNGSIDVKSEKQSTPDLDSLESPLHTFEHPINCEKIEFSPEPVPVSRVFDNDQIISVVCGDNHSMFLTAKGKVYAWG